MFPLRRRGLPAAVALVAGATVAVGCLAAPAAAQASAAAPAPAGARARAAAPGADPTITIRVGGVRTAESGPPGPPAATGLPGVTFRVSPSSAGQPDTCVSTAAGLCTLPVDAGRTYTLTQESAPGGWFANRALDAGSVSPNTVTRRPYDTLSVTVGTANVTVPTPAPNTDTAPTARSGTWAMSRANPALPDGCGLRIALLFDLSSSITSGILPTYKAAGRGFVDALKDTPSHIAVYTFGTSAPAPGGNNANLVPPVSVANAAGVTTLNNKIDGLSVPSSSYTNWDAGIWQIARDDSTYDYQAAVVLTDGDPTRYGPSGNLGGTTSSVNTRFAETENGIFSANALKDEHTTVLAVGIGTRPEGLEYADNIRAISGPVEDTDYFNTDFGRLRHVLTQLALRNCAGLDLTKTAAPTTYTHVGQEITYTYTVTNPKFFTLHDVHVTDDRVHGRIPCTPSTLATGESATCTATYKITQADLDAGHVTNTATATGTTPNHDDVTSDPADETVHARHHPGIKLVKSASPTRYAAAGEKISYTYTVTNTGNVTLRHVTVHDDRLGAVTCPDTELAPGQTTTCEAVHITTRDDVAAGRVVNAATATGVPPTGTPVTGEDRDTVRFIHRPGIEVEKAAFPAKYAVPGELITYTYTVTNTGNVTLRHVRLHDSRLGEINCPATMLAPAESMTCHATHRVTKHDVDVGRIANAATATGRPPAGPPVAGTDTETVHAIRIPGIAVAKSAAPAAYHAAGERITYTYTVVNTGNVTLHHLTVTDNEIHGPIACRATRLAPGEATTCRATRTVTKADVAAGRLVNVATAAARPPAGAQVKAKALATALLTPPFPPLPPLPPLPTLPEVPVTG